MAAVSDCGSLGARNLVECRACIRRKDEMVDEQAPKFESVRAACVACHDEQISEAELTAVLVALPIVAGKQMPDGWSDAVLRARGPVLELQEAHRARLIVGDVYERVIGAMLDAGHQA